MILSVNLDVMIPILMYLNANPVPILLLLFDL